MDFRKKPRTNLDFIYNNMLNAKHHMFQPDSHTILTWLLYSFNDKLAIVAIYYEIVDGAYKNMGSYKAYAEEPPQHWCFDNRTIEHIGNRL